MILAGLASAIVLAQTVSIRAWISWITVFIVVAMYGLDVHTLDLTRSIRKEGSKTDIYTRFPYEVGEGQSVLD